MAGVTIECRDVVKTFGGVIAVNTGQDIWFRSGRVTALVGPNGAGKTTLFHLIAGTMHPDSGDILYNGKRISNLPAWQIARLGLGRLFQDVRIFNKLTALENVVVAFQQQLGENPVAPFFLPRAVAKREAALKREAEELLRFVGLQHQKTDLGEALSYGQQKLLAIARLLAAHSDVLLLDEPTAGVNPEMVKHLISVIRRLASDGKTIVVIEHNVNVVTEIADWVVFMDEGQVIGFGPPSEVLSDERVRAAYIGM